MQKYVHTQAQLVSDNKLALYVQVFTHVFPGSGSEVEPIIRLMDWSIEPQQTIWEGTIEELAEILKERNMEIIRISLDEILEGTRP